jgi:hypothetical protein
LMSWHCHHQRWHLHLSQLNASRFTSLILHNSRICSLWCSWSKKKKSYCDRHPTYQFLLLTIKVFGYLHKQVDMFLHDCANAIWNLKGLEAFISLFWLFPSLKKFNHIANDASLFHFKPGDSCRLIYFLTPTPSGCTSHHNDQPIASDRFLTLRNVADLLQWSIFDMETFGHLVCSNLTACKFSLFLFLIPLYIFQIYDVFINKSFASLHHHIFWLLKLDDFVFTTGHEKAP